MAGVESQAGEGVTSGTEAASEAAGNAVQHTIGHAPQAALKKPALPLGLIAGLGIAAVAALCVLLLVHPGSSAAPPGFQDLGEAISNVTGLRGTLKTRWQNNAVEYQLEVEPIRPFENTTFAFVAAHPTAPMSLHIKLVDATGYALCGKDVPFPSEPGSANRKLGQDTLQPQLGDDGKIVSLSTQGTAPCTQEQYKQVDHWDFTTSFPTLTQQDALMKQAAAAKAREEAQKRRALELQRSSRSAFYLEGDDRAAAYDASRNVLETQLGRQFLVSAPAQRAAANLWAGSGASFHYKCDQHSRCALVHAGGGQSLSVTAVQ